MWKIPAHSRLGCTYSNIGIGEKPIGPDRGERLSILIAICGVTIAICGVTIATCGAVMVSGVGDSNIPCSGMAINESLKLPSFIVVSREIKLYTKYITMGFMFNLYK